MILGEWNLSESIFRDRSIVFLKLISGRYSGLWIVFLRQKIRNSHSVKKNKSSFVSHGREEVCKNWMQWYRAS